jgi:hypothetical protein
MFGCIQIFMRKKHTSFTQKTKFMILRCDVKCLLRIHEIVCIVLRSRIIPYDAVLPCLRMIDLLVAMWVQDIRKYRSVLHLFNRCSLGSFTWCEISGKCVSLDSSL